jgi:Platelet-activating factor acetylhydrolase, isoform II
MSLSGIASAELKLFIWYPAVINPDTSVRVQNVWGFSKSLDKFVQTHTVENAAIAGGDSQFPLILFSPDIGNESAAYLSQVENLVSHGYIVASLQSSESLNAISFQDTRLTVFEADMRRAFSFPTTRDVESALARAQRFEQSREEAEAAKLRFAFNHVILISAGRSQHAPFAGRIDLENVGAFGHGSGANAVAQLCASDVRIAACLDEDGWTPNGLLSQANPSHLPRQPFLWIDIPLKWSERAELTYAHITRDQFTRLTKSSATAADLQLKLLAGDAYRITLLAPDLNDKNFTDGPLVWSMKRGHIGSAEARTALAVTNLYSRTFFDKYLKGGSASLLDSNTDSPFSEVSVRRYVAPER